MSKQTSPVARLQQLGHALPEPPEPVASYVAAKRSGSLLFISGQIPMRDGELMARGRVPGEVSVERATACAVQCALNGLAAAKGALGSLDRIASVVRVSCFVASDPGFHDQPKVANGASELLVEVFGEAGKHARAAVGASELPLGVPVEVEFVLEVSE